MPNCAFVLDFIPTYFLCHRNVASVKLLTKCYLFKRKSCVIQLTIFSLWRRLWHHNPIRSTCSLSIFFTIAFCYIRIQWSPFLGLWISLLSTSGFYAFLPQRFQYHSKGDSLLIFGSQLHFLPITLQSPFGIQH